MKKDTKTTLYCPSCGSTDLFVAKSDIAQSGNRRHRCRTCDHRTTRPLLKSPQILPKFDKTKKYKRYIITSAVNDTPIHDMNHFNTLKVMADKLDARLIVIATVYRNPDMVKQGFLSSLKWPAEVLPYICQERVNLNKNLAIRGDARIRTTILNPLQGANHAGDTRSEIFGHPQTALEMVATPSDSVPKVLLTTGTISKPNYGGSWSAKKAEFHHTYNALFVEISGDKFWPTQLPWDGTGIQLFDKYYDTYGTTTSDTYEALVHGDIHRDIQTKKEKQLTDDLVKHFDSEIHVLHDVHDGHTGSHHREGRLIENLRHPDFDIRAELDRTVKFIKSVKNAVIVSSNHHDHLDQWFERYNHKRPDQNITLYADLMELVRKYPTCGLFEAYCRDQGVTCDFTDPNKEYDICGIDCSQHFHKGPNGSRGSAAGFAKTGRKTIGGHSHTPKITKGAWQTGTSSMYHRYAQGYSSWLVAHILISETGKRSMLFAIKGKLSPLLTDWIKRTKQSKSS